MTVEQIRTTRKALDRRERAVRVLATVMREYSARYPVCARSDLRLLGELGFISPAEEEQILDCLLPLRRTTVEYVPQPKRESCWEPTPDDAA